jgi:hypothetical protein
MYLHNFIEETYFLLYSNNKQLYQIEYPLELLSVIICPIVTDILELIFFKEPS